MQSNGFIMQYVAGIDTSFACLAHLVLEILLCMVFKLSFGGHLEKRLQQPMCSHLRGT